MTDPSTSYSSPTIETTSRRKLLEDFRERRERVIRLSYDGCTDIPARPTKVKTEGDGVSSYSPNRDAQYARGPSSARSHIQTTPHQHPHLNEVTQSFVPSYPCIQLVSRLQDEYEELAKSNLTYLEELIQKEDEYDGTTDASYLEKNRVLIIIRELHERLQAQKKQFGEKCLFGLEHLRHEDDKVYILNSRQKCEISSTPLFENTPSKKFVELDENATPTGSTAPSLSLDSSESSLVLISAKIDRLHTQVKQYLLELGMFRETPVVVQKTMYKLNEIEEMVNRLYNKSVELYFRGNAAEEMDQKQQMLSAMVSEKENALKEQNEEYTRVHMYIQQAYDQLSSINRFIDSTKSSIQDLEGIRSDNDKSPDTLAPTYDRVIVVLMQQNAYFKQQAHAYYKEIQLLKANCDEKSRDSLGLNSGKGKKYGTVPAREVLQIKEEKERVVNRVKKRKGGFCRSFAFIVSLNTFTFIALTPLLL